MKNILKRVIVGVLVSLLLIFIKTNFVKANIINNGGMTNGTIMLTANGSPAINSNLLINNTNITLVETISTNQYPYLILDTCTTASTGIPSATEITGTSCNSSCYMKNIAYYDAGQCTINGVTGRNILYQLLIFKIDTLQSGSQYQVADYIKFGGTGYTYINSYFASDNDLLSAIATNQKSTNEIINNNNSNTQDIIDSQNSGTNRIIGSISDLAGINNSNSSAIINNNNSNTQNIINNQDAATNRLIGSISDLAGINNSNTNSINNNLEDCVTNIQEIKNTNFTKSGNIYKINKSIPIEKNIPYKITWNTPTTSNYYLIVGVSSNYPTGATTEEMVQCYFNGSSTTSDRITDRRVGNETTFTCTGDGYLYLNFNNHGSSITINSTYKLTLDGGTICKSKIDSVNENLSDVNQGIDNINNSINNDNVDAQDSQINSLINDSAFNDSTGLSSVISAPLRIINNLTNECQPISITIPYINSNLEIPCMSTSVYNKFPSGFITTISVIVNGFLVYRMILSLYGMIHKFKDPEDDKIEVVDL